MYKYRIALMYALLPVMAAGLLSALYFVPKAFKPAPPDKAFARSFYGLYEPRFARNNQQLGMPVCHQSGNGKEYCKVAVVAVTCEYLEVKRSSYVVTRGSRIPCPTDLRIGAAPLPKG